MPEIIKFKESQTRLIREIQAKHAKELGNILDMIAKEHGILDDIKKNPQRWAFEEDWSGMFKIEKPKKDKK